MLSFICFILCASSYAVGIVLPRQNGAPDPGDATVSDPPLQSIPAIAKPDNTFSNGQPEIIGGFPYDTGEIPPEYQPRDIDIPFGRQFHGDLMMFPEGQLNQPDRNTDEWTPNIYDFANQSACGIPDNSYVQMKVAIHPYFLKYAGLDQGEFTNDMIAKVTDICSTDPSDPTHCATPSDIKVDRAKVQVMYDIPLPGSANAALQAPKYIKGTYWHLTKCWGNALPQPAYRDNWWAQPPLPNNFAWDVDATGKQMQNNQNSYPSKGWSTYPDGTSSNAASDADIVPITDWVPGMEPAWTPIAGGKGFGCPECSKGPPGGGVAGSTGETNATLVTVTGGVTGSTSSSTGSDEESCSDDDDDDDTSGPGSAVSATTQSTSPAISTTPQPSGAATLKRDQRETGRGWKLAAGKRVVNGITYWNPTRWNQNSIQRVAAHR
ncbi:hypothetical protein P7C71_g2924, partial [Lecanoromycetidae sp. Uapishka_2]